MRFKTYNFGQIDKNIYFVALKSYQILYYFTNVNMLRQFDIVSK